MQFIWQVLLMLDGVIYDLIYYIYRIFFFLSQVNIFSEEHYRDIVDRLYIILGIFMLFVLAYSLLRAVISPDDFAKGENSFPNLVKNVVISIVIIMVLPTVFSVAFNFQNAILRNDTIPRLILGDNSQTDGENLTTNGRLIVYELFNAFFTVNQEYCNLAIAEGRVNKDGEILTDLADCRGYIIGNGSLFFRNGDPLEVYDDKVLNEYSSFTYYMEYSEAVAAREINYLFPISTVAGIFFLYVLLNFTFDMAVRVVKLAFYQLIAPIPVICRILPGGNMKDVFSKWVKQIISVFLEVFIRVGIMAIGIYLMLIIIDLFGTNGPYNPFTYFSNDPLLGFISFALLIMAVVIFMRQAPKLLGELLNLDTGGMKLGLMDKLAMGGGLLAAGAATTVGTGAVGFARNVLNRAQNYDYNKRGGLIRGIGSSIVSGIAGGTSAALRTGKNVRNAKNLGDIKAGASKGLAENDAKRAGRELYKANHGGTTLGVVRGHFQDMFTSAKELVGVSPTLEGLKIQQESVDYVNSSVKDLEDSSRNLIESDANKGKSKDYGIITEYGSYISENMKTMVGLGKDGKLNTVNGIDINKFNTSVLRQLNQAKAAAAASGGTYGGFTIAQWEDLINDYSDVFSKEVANQGLLSNDAISALSDDVRNDLKDIIVSAQKLRGAVQDNMTSDFVKNANITPEFISENNSIDIRSEQISDLKDNMKQASTDIGIALAQKRNEEKKKSDDNH